MRRTVSAVLFFVLAAAAHAQAISGVCGEDSAGSSTQAGSITTVTTGDTVVLMAYIGGNSNTVSNATWSSGTVTLTVDSNAFTAGPIVVAGISPSGYNGVFTITGHTTTSLSYSLGSNPGTYVSGGAVGGEIVSVSDDAVGGSNTYAEISGAPMAYTGGTNNGEGGMTIWASANAKANTGGGLDITITYTTGNTFNAACFLDVTSMPATLGVDAIQQGTGTSTTLDTSSIGGNFTHEVFLTQALIEGTQSNPVACGGVTFANFPGGNGVGGNPGASFVSGASTGTVCAGLPQSSATPAKWEIVSLKSSSSTGGAHGGYPLILAEKQRSNGALVAGSRGTGTDVIRAGH